LIIVVPCVVFKSKITKNDSSTRRSISVFVGQTLVKFGIESLITVNINIVFTYVCLKAYESSISSELGSRS
jgi:hypothetical protein